MQSREALLVSCLYFFITCLLSKREINIQTFNFFLSTAPVLFSGSETTIHCAGPNHLSPIVSLEWTFNHTQTILNQSTETQSYTVSETWRQKVKNVSANGSLTLNYVTPDQQGLYTCHLTTDNETYMTDTLLEIHGETRPMFRLL